MVTRKQLPIIVFCVVFIFGCEEQSMQGDIGQSCFGLSNSFYGRPNHYQQRNLPQAMRGAYCIEPVKNITMTDLKEMLKKKQLVAEEFQKGERYVAMRDSRIVQFDTFVSGLVIIIERYHILDN